MREESTLEVNNRIITADDLNQIFSMMNDTLNKWLKVYQNESRQNEPLDYKYQKWSFKDEGSMLVFEITFYDNTTIKFDNYGGFIGVFNNKIYDIKEVYARFMLHYNIQDEFENKYYHSHIIMRISENRISTDISVSNEDNKMKEIYRLIQEKFNNAQTKYDSVIKKRRTMMLISSFALGLIPALVICIGLMFVPAIKGVISEAIVAFPIAVLIFGYFIGDLIANNVFGKLYEGILPDKKYAGWSRESGATYVDDVDSYTSSCEILIGHNTDNLKKREEIKRKYSKYKKLLPYELGALIIATVIIIVL